MNSPGHQNSPYGEDGEPLPQQPTLWPGILTAILLIVVCVLAGMVGGCTLINTPVGAVTGIVDCTLYRGVAYLPLAPFEGAYRGAQLGWRTDRRIASGQNDDVPILAHVVPCSVHYTVESFGGGGLSWGMP